MRSWSRHLFHYPNPSLWPLMGLNKNCELGEVKISEQPEKWMKKESECFRKHSATEIHFYHMFISRWITSLTPECNNSLALLASPFSLGHSSSYLLFLVGFMPDVHVSCSSWKKWIPYCLNNHFLLAKNVGQASGKLFPTYVCYYIC